MFWLPFFRKADHAMEMIDLLQKRSYGSFWILLAGIFWGSMGLFVRYLNKQGFSPLQIVSIRLSFASLIFCILLLIRSPGSFRIRMHDIPLFLGLGLLSILFFTICYFTAIRLMPLSTAAILLYTSPIWVMLMSVVFFHEHLNRRNLLALALAFCGCVLVSGISGGNITVLGLLVGLGSGIGYGLYSILGTIALRRYSPLTVTTYTFLIAALGSWVVSPPAMVISQVLIAASPLRLLLFFLLTALITAVIPFLSYTLGLQTVEPSRAAILATVEPLVATLFGFFVFDESLSLSCVLGIILILAAVLLLNCKVSSSNRQN